MNSWRLFLTLLCAALFLLFSHSVNAIANSYSSRLWQTDEGLPHNTVHAIDQTMDGYLWVGTREGLARFDGVRFVQYDPSNVSALKHPSILSLCASRDGTLWIGTEGGGMTQWKDGEFSSTDRLELSNPVVRALHETAGGTLWIGTYGGGLTSIRGNAVTRLTRESGLADNTVRSVFVDSQGILWVATIWGLSQVKDGVVVNYTEDNGLKHNSVRAVCEDRDGNIWIGSNGGLSRFRDGTFTHYTKKDGLSDNVVGALHLDRNGVLWIGTFDGLTRFENGKFFSETRDTGESYNQVFSIFEDREGNIWVGTREGLNRLKVRLFQSYTQQDGLTHNTITSVFEDRSGTLWIGTGGGLNFIKNGTIGAYTMTNGLRSDLVRGIHEGRDGSLWFGTAYDGGLNRLHKGELTFYGRPELWDSPENIIHEDRKGNLWLGSPFALNRLKDGHFTRYANNTSPSLPHFEIVSICEDREGSIWVGTANGLTRWRDEQFSTEGLEALPRRRVLALYEDSEQALWISLAKHGLIRFKNGKFTHYTLKDGLFDDVIFEILEDGHGFFWMASRRGIFRVRRKDMEEVDRGVSNAFVCSVFGKSDGMVSTECQDVAKPGACRSQDGRLWFSTINGLVSVDPAKITIDQTPPPVIVEQVIVDKKPAGRQSSTTDLVINDQSRITSAPGRGEVEIHYTGLSLRAPEKNRFKFKLEGVDSDWVDAGTRRVAYYNNLKPGDYRFHVIGCNSDGVWNQRGATVNLSLLPYYWQTNWFLGLISFVAIGLVAGTARFMTWKRLQYQLQHLEKRHAIEKERTRIARDIHDDLGARFTEILLTSTRARENKNDPEAMEVYADRMLKVARNLSDSMSALVWAINPQNDTLDRFSTYVSEYAQAFLDAASIRFRFQMPDDLPDCHLGSDARHNLFLVIKEALNNAVKYSGCSEVWLRLQSDGSTLSLWIEDNGKGFSRAAVSSSGNGLGNMQKRMNSIGGQCEISSDGGEGTRICLKMPMPEKQMGMEQ